MAIDFMDNEKLRFFEQTPPFNTIAKSDLEQLLATTNLTSLCKGDTLPVQGAFRPCIYIVKKGELSCWSEKGDLVSRFDDGDICRELGQFWNCGGEPLGTPQQKVTVKCEEDSFVYSIECHLLTELGNQYVSIKDYFCQDPAHRLKKEMIQVHEKAIISSTLMNTKISRLYNAPAATISNNATIQQAAIEMSARKHSSLIVLQETKPIGIVTDKDIRLRCVAQGLSSDEKVTKIMTANMSTIDSESSAYDALMTMTAKQIHHIPVTVNNKVVGVITATDLMNREGQNAINLVSIIHKATTISELHKISALVPKLQIRLAHLGGSADYVGKSISAVTMAFTKRLIEMAQDKIGKSPVPFAWFAAGSQARQEQLVHTDQDNVLIISNDMTEQDDEWFKQLAQFVCDGLVECGFVYCPGNNMAINLQWRQPVRVWEQYFTDWIENSDAKTLASRSIFFDLECMYGDKTLLDGIRQNAFLKISENESFVNHLSQNAINQPPPLGFFRDFVLTQNGEGKESLDLKASGITPIVDLARLFALTQGIETVNTIERIKLAAKTSVISKVSADNMIDAFEFIGMLRVKHQAKSLSEGLKSDNYVSPKELSKLEREHLKDAFKVIKTIQGSKQANYYNCG